MSGDTGKRLSPELWVEIRTKYLEGRKISELAREYGVSRQTIQTHISRENWKKPVDIKKEALLDIQEDLKKDFKEQAREELLKDKKVYEAVRELCFIAVEELKDNRLQGKRLQQLKLVLECFKLCSDGMRATLGVDPISPERYFNRELSPENILWSILHPETNDGVMMLEGGLNDSACALPVIQAEFSS